MQTAEIRRPAAPMQMPRFGSTLLMIYHVTESFESSFYNVRTQGILYVHSKLITGAVATFEISIPISFFFLKHEILHSKLYDSLKFIQNVISYQLDTK